MERKSSEEKCDKAHKKGRKEIINRIYGRQQMIKISSRFPAPCTLIN